MIEESDITLKDRKIDFYPSDVSICNDSCELEKVDLTTEKIKCTCDILFLFNAIKKEKEEKIEKTSYTYTEYIKSLFNYKIIFCQKLLLETKYFVKNIGMYVGSIITFACITLFIINLTLGNKTLNQIIIENEPSISKLKKKLKNNLKKQKRKLKKLKARILVFYQRNLRKVIGEKVFLLKKIF